MNVISIIKEIIATSPFFVMIIMLLMLSYQYMKTRKDLAEKGVTPESVEMQINKLVLKYGDGNIQCCNKNNGVHKHIKIMPLVEDQANLNVVKICNDRKKLMSRLDIYYKPMLIIPPFVLIYLLVAVVINAFRTTQYNLGILIMFMALVITEMGMQQYMCQYFYSKKAIIDQLPKCES